MKKYIISSIFTLSVLCSFAQNVEFTKDNFKDKKSELKDALKNIEMGDRFYFNQPFPSYSQALPLYEAANTFNPNNAVLNYRLGICYINGNRKFKALEFFQKAHKLKPDVDPEIQFYLGRGNQLLMKFDEAITHFEKYKASLDLKKQGDLILSTTKRIEECKNGKTLVKTPINVWIDNMGKNVNSEFPEYGMIMNADASEIYFTSRRPNTTGGGKDEFINDYFEDIYYSKRVGKDWSPSANLGEPLNSKGHDATVALSPDGSKMIIYIDDKGDGNLYESVRKKDKWSKPSKLNSEICSKYHESSAWYSPDGKLLYFVSDRPISGKEPKDKDIYVASWNAKKETWENVTRLPETINTPYNEDGIFLHPDGKTLYFSSQGHNSMGGYDVFSTTRDDAGNWSKPENVGYPVNTPDDDVFFVVSANGRTAYMTSYREDGLGEKDLYVITFLGEEKKPMLNAEDVLLASSGVPVREKVIEPKVAVRKNAMALLKGTVVDAKTKKPLLASIELIDNQKNEVIATFSTDEEFGKYLVSLPAGKNYGIAVKAEGYLFHSENFDIPKDADYQEFVKNVELKKIEVGQVIVLRNIFFDLNKYSLRDESQNELDRLTKLLTDNPSIKIQISGHTDSRGSAQLNKELSYNRAKAVVDYLVAKGINKNRLEYAGYGKEQPIVTDAEINAMKSPAAKEEAHQNNRRTEFKIISK
jgi:outer membrane protein OmpA-like peptidoglycan-associated protein/tetratricopeptide (TPR) repeat protein